MVTTTGNSGSRGFVAWLAVAGWALLALPAAGQSSKPTPKPTWTEAIKLIDSQSAADVAAAIAMLTPDDASESWPLPRALALALFQLRQGDSAGAAATMQNLEKAPAAEPPGGLEGACLRVKLYAALAEEEASTAENAFKDLVRYLLRGQGEPVDMRAGAHTLGVTVAMLELEEARSPVAQRVLAIGAQCLTNSKLPGVSFAYELAYAQAHERAEALANNLALIERDGLQVVQGEYSRRYNLLQQRQAELDQQKELTSEVARNSREQIEQNTVDLRQLNRDLVKLNHQLSQPTPGHPGLKQPAPQPPPPRAAIEVPEYETRTGYEYVIRNGENVRVPVTRHERRPQYEIDRDRDREYELLMARYNALVGQYQAYEARYEEELRTWTAEDQLRRQDLLKRKSEAEAQRSQLMRANADIKAEKRDFAKELRAIRTAEEQEELDLQILQIALTAALAGQPHSAFRPANFDFLNWSQEKLLMQP